MTNIILFLLGFIFAAVLVFYAIVKNFALLTNTYKNSVVTEYLIQQSAHDRELYQGVIALQDGVIERQNGLITQFQVSTTPLLAAQKEVKNILPTQTQTQTQGRKALFKRKGLFSWVQNESGSLSIVNDSGQMFADIFASDLPEKGEKKLVYDSEDLKIYVAVCDVCGGYYPTQSLVTSTCSGACRQKKSTINLQL